MKISNYLEEVVPSAVTRLIADHPHIRDCEACASDVLALTFTSLKPGYSSTEVGRVLNRLGADKAQGHAQITVAVLSAIDVVKKFPRHGTRHS